MEVYKAAGNYIITLQIDPDGENNLDRDGVVDKNYAKFRCREAQVVKIKSKFGKETLDSIESDYHKGFIYKVGEKVVEPSYNEKYKNNVCGDGIHFYLSKEAAYYHRLYGINGLIKDFYPSGQLSQQGVWKNLNPDGEWLCYHENGVLQEKNIYQNGNLHGLHQTWYNNGKQAEITNYIDGKKHGLSRKWHNNGQLKLWDIYKDGKSDCPDYIKPPIFPLKRNSKNKRKNVPGPNQLSVTIKR